MSTATFIILLNIPIISLLSDALYDLVDSDDITREEIARATILALMEMIIISYLLMTPITRTHANIMIVMSFISAITVPAWRSLEKRMDDPEKSQLIQWTIIGLLIAGSMAYLFYINRTQFDRLAESRLRSSGYNKFADKFKTTTGKAASKGKRPNEYYAFM